jgi:hypothetical protein
MPLSWGELLYRSSLMLAGFVLAMAFIDFTYQVSIADPRIPLAPFAVAGAIWLAGLFCRNVIEA